MVLPRRLFEIFEYLYAELTGSVKISHAMPLYKAGHFKRSCGIIRAMRSHGALALRERI